MTAYRVVLRADVMTEVDVEADSEAEARALYIESIDEAVV